MISPNPKIQDLLKLYQSNKFIDAEKLATAITMEEPNQLFPWQILGIIFIQSGRFEEALIPIEESIKLSPQNAESYNMLGIALKELGKYKEAKVNLEKAVTLKPNFSEAYNNLGIALKSLGEIDEAIKNYRLATKLNKNFPSAYNNMGVALKELGRSKEAEESYKQAINLKPNFFGVYNNLGGVLRIQGKINEAEETYRQAIKLKPDYFIAYSNLLFLLSGFKYKSSYYLKTAKEYDKEIKKSVTSKFTKWLCKKDSKKLRIGFVSGDFNNHPVGYFLENILKKLEQSEFELYAYPTNLKNDDLTSRIKPYFSAWKPIFGVSDKDAACQIYNDAINILIDLSGHTKHNRLPIFSWKPAPIQISWIGYWASTGLTEMDYVLGDPYVTPFKEASHFTEKIYQLPESYLCFTEPNINIDVQPLPALINNTITFGCFNKIERINDQVVSVWSKILNDVPNSKLFLKDKNLDEISMQNSFYKKFIDNGVNKEQLIFEGKSPRAEYMAAYNRVDIALSPFPYNSVTTSIEGLWMGVPVICKRGDHFLSHISESIAHNTDLSNWIAHDDKEYVLKATKFSSNLNELAKLRKGLRKQVLSSSLFNSNRFIKHFENALKNIWEKNLDKISFKL